MILGSDCRLAADADPSSDFGPAQLLPPPSSWVSLFSTFFFFLTFIVNCRKKKKLSRLRYECTRKKQLSLLHPSRTMMTNRLLIQVLFHLTQLVMKALQLLREMLNRSLHILKAFWRHIALDSRLFSKKSQSFHVFRVFMIWLES